tara:strand:+ start:379 stop:660 length:282 start_codon:yes stop_codon:yes gene_type:complete
MAKPKIYPRVEVTWTDAQESGDIGWNDLKEQLRYAKSPCPIMKNIGYEVYRNDNHITLLHSIGAEQCSSIEKIPISFIKSIVILENKQGEKDG